MASNPANREVDPQALVAYLVAAFQVDEARAKEIVQENAEEVRSAQVLRSHCYYTGNKLAEGAGLVERDDFDPDAEDDDDEDEWT